MIQMLWDILYYLLVFAFLGAAVFAGFLFLQGYLTGTSPTAKFFGPKPEKRVDVVEQWSLDARRRLVLIRRDDVEHLIMTGGPVDVVIETGITGNRARAAPAAESPTPLYSRPARAFGQAAGGQGGGES